MEQICSYVPGSHCSYPRFSIVSLVNIYLFAVCPWRNFQRFRMTDFYNFHQLNDCLAGERVC